MATVTVEINIQALKSLVEAASEVLNVGPSDELASAKAEAEKLLAQAEPKVKALVIGRHTPDFGDMEVEVAGESPVNQFFAATSKEVTQQLMDLETQGIEIGANTVLLQNTPGQVAAAMSQFIPGAKLRWGVVISKPVFGEAGQETETSFASEEAAKAAESAVKAANPRANTEVRETTLVVTADPPRKFEFDHIEWFN